MELKDIFELWDRFDASNVKEMEISMHGVHFSLKEGSEIVHEISTSKPVEATAEKPVETSKSKPVETKKETSPIKAPLVGTFYKAPAQDAKPFVEKGQTIHAGDVVGIIEAMKLMNEVTAPMDGTVDDILVQDGEMVEFDQVLMTIQ